jgi:precorrin-8X/cobalt-precorrin-8 methylmutase
LRDEKEPLKNETDCRPTPLENIAPQDIEGRSFAIIEAELEHSPDPELAPIIKRVIHATADFSYADTLCFSDNVKEIALNALRAGAHIITDTNMAKAGVNQERLTALGGRIHCFMADPDVALAAQEKGVTRAAAAMEKAAALAASLQKPLIFAVGNAPTALAALYHLITDQGLKPALIIGVPVGFVNVVQAKALIMRAGIPFIVNQGRKGGSSVAAAICNALLYMA